MSNITKEINGKEYTFDVTTLDIKLVDYGGFYGTDIRVDVKVKCNNNEDEFSVELCYPMGDAYDYYSEMDYSDLAEMFGETAEEIESDFSAWYDKHSDKLETDYVNLFIDECISLILWTMKQQTKSSKISLNTEKGIRVIVGAPLKIISYLRL